MGCWQTICPNSALRSTFPCQDADSLRQSLSGMFSTRGEWMDSETLLSVLEHYNGKQHWIVKRGVDIFRCTSQRNNTAASEVQSLRETWNVFLFSNCTCNATDTPAAKRLGLENHIKIVSGQLRIHFLSIQLLCVWFLFSLKITYFINVILCCNTWNSHNMKKALP